MNVVNVGVHDKIHFYIEKGGFAVTHAINCNLVYSDFVPLGTVNTGVVISKMAKEIDDLIRKGSHPTLNPCMDKMIELNQEGSLEKTIEKYITDTHQSTTENLDTTSDVMNIEVSLELMMLNVLPFLEQNKIVIKSAIVQTPITRVNIED